MSAAPAVAAGVITNAASHHNTSVAERSVPPRAVSAPLPPSSADTPPPQDVSSTLNEFVMS